MEKCSPKWNDNRNNIMQYKNIIYKNLISPNLKHGAAIGFADTIKQDFLKCISLSHIVFKR